MNRHAAVTPCDEDLIRSYLDGNEAAFATLFQRYKNGIFFLVRNYFKNQERAEEVFQEVFQKLFERMDRFDASGSFRGWFYTLCRNHCIDRIRQKKRQREEPETHWEGEDGQLPGALALAEAPGATAETQAYDGEIATLVDQALQKLPEDQRETFLLKERGGLTFEEIADMMRVSVNTAKSRMRYALAALRRSLCHKNFVKEVLS